MKKRKGPVIYAVVTIISFLAWMDLPAAVVKLSGTLTAYDEGGTKEPFSFTVVRDGTKHLIELRSSRDKQATVLSHFFDGTNSTFLASLKTNSVSANGIHAKGLVQKGLSVAGLDTKLSVLWFGFASDTVITNSGQVKLPDLMNRGFPTLITQRKRIPAEVMLSVASPHLPEKCTWHTEPVVLEYSTEGKMLTGDQTFPVTATFRLKNGKIRRSITVVTEQASPTDQKILFPSNYGIAEIHDCRLYNAHETVVRYQLTNAPIPSITDRVFLKGARFLAP